MLSYSRDDKWYTRKIPGAVKEGTQQKDLQVVITDLPKGHPIWMNNDLALHGRIIVIPSRKSRQGIGFFAILYAFLNKKIGIGTLRKIYQMMKEQ